MRTVGSRHFVRLGAIATKSATMAAGLLLGTAPAHSKDKATKGRAFVERWMNSWMARQPRAEKAVRDRADEIFRFEMQDLRVQDRTIATIYRDPSVLWEDWKRRAEVFA